MENGMKLLILGGSNIQLNTIKKAKEKKITTIVSDFNIINPGKTISDYSECVSTFDIKNTLNVAKKYEVDGVLTVGTDQPVYTVAKIQKKLGLPQFITEETALAVTNKKVMKKKFCENDLANNKYIIINKYFNDDIFKNFIFPVVMKPLDSQGQRGIYKLNSIKEIRENIESTISFSRTDEVIVEEYYLSDEITVSGWVKNGETHLLTITDRLKFELNKHIGICYGHNFKSKYFDEYFDEISDFSKKIVKVFNIENGPIYFQFLIGRDGLRINEIACRIGGAYEDLLIPKLTNVDILEMLINYSLGLTVDYSQLEDYDIKNNENYASVQLFFIKPGRIVKLENLSELEHVYSGGYNIEVNQNIGTIVNASARAGYFITFGKNKEELDFRINEIFNQIKVLDENGNNLIITYKEFNDSVESWYCK
jgi:carbamoylphosphate synthase large subunit